MKHKIQDTNKQKINFEGELYNLYNSYVRSYVQT